MRAHNSDGTYVTIAANRLDLKSANGIYASYRHRCVSHAYAIQFSMFPFGEKGSSESCVSRQASLCMYVSIWIACRHTHTHTNRSDIGTTFLNVQSNHNQPYGFRLIPQHIYLLDIVSSLHVYFFSKSGTRFNLLSKTTHQITFLSSSSSLDCKSVCACKCVECLWWC